MDMGATRSIVISLWYWISLTHGLFLLGPLCIIPSPSPPPPTPLVLSLLLWRLFKKQAAARYSNFCVNYSLKVVDCGRYHCHYYRSHHASHLLCIREAFIRPCLLSFFSRRRDCCGFLLPPNKPRPLSLTHTHSRREQEPERGGNSTTLQLLRLCVVVVQYSFCCELLFYYSSRPLPGNSVALEGEEEEAVLHNWLPIGPVEQRPHVLFSSNDFLFNGQNKKV